MKYITIIFLFTCCWDKEINEKKYKLNTPCIKNHIEVYIEYIYIGNNLYPQTRLKNICDCYGKADTIWQYKNNK
jgi:hypothetical protein